MIAPTRRSLLAAASAMGVVGLPTARAATHLDQVIVISGDDIGTLDPTKTNSARDLTIINCITNRLVRLSNTKTGEVEPLLATSLVAVEPNRWRATLRQGVRFHNNEPFNAETAKWSLIHYATTALLKVVLDPLDHIDIIDDHTMDIVTKFPTGLMPLMLGTTSEMLEPKWMTSSQYSPAALVGTGCTKLLSWSKGQQVVLQTNEEYWGGKLPIDRLLTRAVPEASTRSNAALAGEGDIVRNILSQDVPRFAGRAGVTIRRVESNRCAHIRFRMDIAPFSNKLVRQAVNYAVDMDTIVNNVLGGFGSKLSGQMQAPFARYWQPSIKPYPYDPDKARALLKQAGYPNGFSTKLDTPRGRDQGDFEFSSAVAGMLGDVGIDVEVVVNESGAYQAKYAGIEPAAPLFYWSTGNMIPDAENSFRDIQNRRAGLELRSDAFAAIAARMARAVDPAERNAVALEGITFMRDYAPLLFGYQLQQVYATSDRVKWTPRADEYVYLDEIGVA